MPLPHGRQRVWRVRRRRPGAPVLPSPKPPHCPISTLGDLPSTRLNPSKVPGISPTKMHHRRHSCASALLYTFPTRCLPKHTPHLGNCWVLLGVLTSPRNLAMRCPSCTLTPSSPCHIPTWMTGSSLASGKQPLRPQHSMSMDMMRSGATAEYSPGAEGHALRQVGATKRLCGGELRSQESA